MKHQPFFDLLAEIIAGFCAYKDDLKIYDNGGILTVLPHAADHPKLIGGQGRQVNAFKFAVQQFAQHHGLTLGFAVQESFIGQREDRRPFVFNPNFDKEKADALISQLASFLFNQKVELRSECAGSSWLVTLKTPEDVAVYDAINRIFYPYGQANGRRLQLKHEPTETPCATHPALRSSER